MHIFIQYSIEVVLASVLLSTFYFVFLKDVTLFRLNRFYLLSAIVLPVVFPLINLSLPTSEILPNITVLLDEVTIGIQPVQTAATTLSLWQYIYIAVVSILALRMIIGLRCIISLFKKAQKYNIDGTVLYVSTQNVNPFSVFQRIVVSQETYSDQTAMSNILIHEQAHVNQHHGIDVFISEIVCILFWFNPVVWLLKKELKSTHEYLADEKVLEHDLDLAKYFMLMLDNIVGRNVGLANNFNQSLNLKRMKMMKKKRSSRFTKLACSVAVPLMFGATILLTSQCTSQENEALAEEVSVETKSDEVQADQNTATDENIFMVVEQMPQFPGGTKELMKYLRTNVKYPAEAQEMGLQGRVYIEFVIRKDGEVTNVKTLKGVDPIIDAEAIRVVEMMPNWTPGMQRGENVNVSYRLPINFTLR